MSSGSGEEGTEEGREHVAAAQAPPVPPEKGAAGETKRWAVAVVTPSMLLANLYFSILLFLLKKI